MHSFFPVSVSKCPVGKTVSKSCHFDLVHNNQLHVTSLHYCISKHFSCSLFLGLTCAFFLELVEFCYLSKQHMLQKHHAKTTSAKDYNMVLRRNDESLVRKTEADNVDETNVT